MGEAFITRRGGGKQMKVLVNQSGPDATSSLGWSSVTFNDVPFTVRGFSLSAHATRDNAVHSFFYDDKNEVNRSGAGTRVNQQGKLSIHQEGNSVTITLDTSGGINALIPRQSIYDVVLWG